MTIGQVVDEYAEELDWIAEYDDCGEGNFIDGSKFWKEL